MDLRDKIQSQENALEKLMRKIPGFEGYKNREQRRSADQIQRGFMADELAKQKSELQDLGGDLIRAGKMELMDEIERTSNIYDKVIEKLRHATYGYSGLLDSVRIGEEELDKLYEYDLSLVNNISVQGEAIMAFRGMIEGEGDPKTTLRDLQKKLRDLDNAINDREKVVTGVMSNG